MGQLEKYGLYVLCLVIFLILGVALWGEPVAAAGMQRQNTLVSAPARADVAIRDLSDFKELMSPAAKPDDSADQRARGADPLPAPAVKGDLAAAADGAEPAVEPPAAETVRRTHTVVAGDTFEGIARQELGDIRFVPLLRQLNPKITPERLQLGKPVVLPTAKELAELRAASAPKVEPTVKTDAKTDAAKPDRPKAAAARTHRIERGDTLEGLSVQYFGTKKRVDDIKRLNPSIDPTRLRIGQLVRLPD